MDLLRLPWIQNGGQGRPQFPLDHLFRRDERAGPAAQAGERAAHGAGGPPMDDTDNFNQTPGKDLKIMSPLQKVLDGKLKYGWIFPSSFIIHQFIHKCVDPLAQLYHWSLGGQTLLSNHCRLWPSHILY